MFSLLKRLCVTAAVLVGVSSPALAQGPAPDPERAAARQVFLELALDLQTGKWASADSLFATRGLHVLADTTAYHSWAGYRDGQLKPELARYTNLKVAHTGVEAQVRGAVSWVAFRQEISGTSSSGPAQRVSRGSAVLEKVDGRWIVVHLHLSR
ncbi:MAG: nuclear transport factor 2 family protein [Gemmatimonadaceae bacterium]